MAPRKEALGRGLSAILESNEEPLASGRPAERIRQISEIDMALIRPNPFQPRRDFDEEALLALAHSIEQLGIIQPITVRTGENGYELISGERRLRAARRAGLERIPAYIREVDADSMLQMAIVENIQREDLNPIEEALAYRRLMEECAMTHEGVARSVAKSRSAVTNMLRLLRLPPIIQAGLRDGDVSVGHARVLINIEDEKTQVALFKAIKAEGLSVREIERRVRENRRTDDRKNKKARSPGTGLPKRDALQLEQYTVQLRNHLGTRVGIRSQGDGGRIEIDYYSGDDLERLLELITGK